MLMEEIRSGAYAKGDQVFPPGPWIIDTVDLTEHGGFKRIVFKNKEGKRMQFTTSTYSAFEIMKEKEPPKVTVFEAEISFKETLGTIKEFKSEAEAMDFCKELGHDWKWSIKPVEKIATPRIEPAAVTDDLPF